MTISDGVLYQARIAVPSNVVDRAATPPRPSPSPQGRVIASAVAEVEVASSASSASSPSSAEQSSLLYGLFAVGLSVLMGWLAGRVFALV